MVKSEIINLLAEKLDHLSHKDVEFSVNTIINSMSKALTEGKRIEIRNFGRFQLNYHPPRKAHNPRTREHVVALAKYVPHFKAGKGLRETVNDQYGTPMANDKE